MYQLFQEKSRLLQYLYTDLVRHHSKPPEGSVAEFLFSLNADAYRVRYGHNDGVEAEIAEAAADLSEDDLDYDFENVKNWNNFAQVRQLLKRIQYQCAEFPPGHEANDRMDMLSTMIEELHTMVMRCLESTPNLPTAVTQFC